MKAMILAAGRGERLRPLTDSTPKALIKVGTQPLIEKHLYALASSGFTEVIINTSYLAKQIEETVGEGKKFGIKVTFSREQKEALGTGGGIFNALPLLGDTDILVVNADIYTDYAFTQKMIGQNDLAHLVLVKNPKHNPKGDFCLLKNRIVASSETKLTFSGIGYYKPGFFAQCKGGKFPLLSLLQAAILQNKVSAEQYDGRWVDVGTPERLEEANKLSSS